MPLDAEQRARVVALRNQGWSYERIHAETQWGIRQITEAIVEAEHVAAGIAVASSANPRIAARLEAIGETWLAAMELAQQVMIVGLEELLKDPVKAAAKLQTVSITAGVSADKVLDFGVGRRGAEINISDNRSMFSGMSTEELMAEIAAVKSRLANSEALPGEFEELPGG